MSQYPHGSKSEYLSTLAVTAMNAAFASWAEFALHSITSSQLLMAAATERAIFSFSVSNPATQRKQNAMLRRSQFRIVRN